MNTTLPPAQFSQTVSGKYEYLYHYTTAAGLHGILSDQGIRATNYSYLNDIEEVEGFLEHRLPKLLIDGLQKQVAFLYQNDSTKKDFIDQKGGIEAVVKLILEELLEGIRDSFKKINEPFISSFCGAKSDVVATDGLLSQWRGYGTDGGYAIAFDTKGIENLLRAEDAKYPYGLLSIGDVDYHDPNSKSELPEILDYEQIIATCIEKYISSGATNDLDATYTPITALACTHKHFGFHEETEVRIVAIPPCKELVKQIRQHGDNRALKEIEFVTRNGVLVPYLTLFKGLDGLPIKKIIVGPSHDSLKRKKSVEMLLRENEIEAEVICSNIPFVGR